jgi:hypothetical protein
MDSQSVDHKAMRPPEEQVNLAKGFIQANRIAEAPFLKLQAMMYAVMAMKAAGGQKEPPNEGMGTDVDNVAHLLPYCDATFPRRPLRFGAHGFSSWRKRWSFPEAAPIGP